MKSLSNLISILAEKVRRNLAERRRVRLYNKRYTPEEQKEMDEMDREMVENLNKNTRK